MRVTNSMTMRGTLRDLNSSLVRLQNTQTQLSTGKQLTKASDDPSAAATAMLLRKQLTQSDHHSRSLTDARGWLETADSTLTSSLDLVSQAKTIAVRAASSGGLSDANARLAMATELRSIRADMIAVANTTYGTRSIFGGTIAGPAYSAAGAYLGNGASVVRDVSPQTNVTVNIGGQQVFGVAGGPVGDIFEVLDRLATAVTSGNDAAIAAEHANLDNAGQTLGAAAVDIGSRAARLDGITARLADDQSRLRTQLSTVEDVDIAAAMVTEKAQENSYQAGLQVAAKILPPSLLDYLH
jgi:flagellar hook-associated protein 3 FlgL